MIAKIHDMEMREEGREEGREEERLSAVRNVMASLGVGADEAMGILGIPEPERPACIEGLQDGRL